MDKRFDITGKRFGRWRVLSYDRMDGKNGSSWHCECSCGNQRFVRRARLVNGRSQSCGCLHKEIVGAMKTTHGKHAEPVYNVWQGMKARCRNKNNHAYKYYGGRGITVCNRWLKFENFISDMGHMPSALHELDRIDNDKGYSKKNCRWATRRQQMRNTRQNRLITFNGETLCLSAWAEKRGLTKETLAGRLNFGQWPLAEALGFKPHVRRYIRGDTRWSAKSETAK